MSKCSYLWWYSMRLLFCFYTFAFSKCFAMDRFYSLTTISFKIMPCKNVQITSFTVTVLWWLLVIPSREQATVPLTIPVTEHLSFFPTFTRPFHGDPTPFLGLRPCGAAQQRLGNSRHAWAPPATLFSWKDGPPSSPTSTVGGRLPSRPPLPETVQAAEPLPGGQERVGNGFDSDASVMTPGPEPREWFLRSPVPRTEPAEKKKSKQMRERLCWEKTHRD